MHTYYPYLMFMVSYNVVKLNRCYDCIFLCSCHELVTLYRKNIVGELIRCYILNILCSVITNLSRVRLLDFWGILERLMKIKNY